MRSRRPTLTSTDERAAVRHADRRDRYATVATSLSLRSDRSLTDLVEHAPVMGTGIGGTSMVAEVDGFPVFVKCVPLTDLERQPEHVMSTANLFDLPVCCQYGVGSPSFGVWRELAAHAMTTARVLAGRATSFPLLYHWRALPAPANAAPPIDELANVDQAVEYWHGSTAVRNRIEAVIGASASVVLFMEHVPSTLPPWLTAQVRAGDSTAAGAITMVERTLRLDVPQMNTAGLFHFDAHFDNILADGHQLYLADFGLATSPRFELSGDEIEFLRANRSHDVCHTITRLVDWLVTELTDVGDWTERALFVRSCAEGEAPAGLLPEAAAVIMRYAPIAVIMNAFYGKLHTEDRRTAYPTAAVEQACRLVGVDIP